MCEMTKMPKILDYKRDKMVIDQNVVVWNQKRRAAIFGMQGIFASIAKISLGSKISLS